MLPLQANPFYPYCSQDIQDAMTAYKITALPFEQNQAAYALSYLEDNAHGYVRPAVKDWQGHQSLRKAKRYFLEETLDYILKTRANAEALRRIVIPINFERDPLPRQWAFLGVTALHPEKNKFDLKKLDLLKRISELETTFSATTEKLLQDRQVKKLLKELYPQTRVSFFDSWPSHRLLDKLRYQDYLAQLQKAYPDLTEITIEQPLIQLTTDMDAGVCVVRNSVAFIKDGKVTTPQKIVNHTFNEAGYVLYRRGKDYENANKLFKQRQHFNIEITQTKPKVTRGFENSPGKLVHLLDEFPLSHLKEHNWLVTEITDGYVIQQNSLEPKLFMNNNRIGLYQFNDAQMADFDKTVLRAAEQMPQILSMVGIQEVAVHCTDAAQQTTMESLCRSSGLAVATQTPMINFLTQPILPPETWSIEERSLWMRDNLVWAYQRMQNNQVIPQPADFLAEISLIEQLPELNYRSSFYFMEIWPLAEIAPKLAELKRHLQVLQLEQLIANPAPLKHLPITSVKQLLKNLTDLSSELKIRLGDSFASQSAHLETQLLNTVEVLNVKQPL